MSQIFSLDESLLYSNRVLNTNKAYCLTFSSDQGVRQLEGLNKLSSNIWPVFCFSFSLHQCEFFQDVENGGPFRYF